MRPRTSRASDGGKFRWIFITVVCCLVCIACTFAVAMTIRSPNEEAVANSRVRTTVTAKVEKRTVQAARNSAKGTLTLGTAWNVNVSAGEGMSPVVTSVNAAAGDTVSSGSILGTVAGRPVMTLQLPFDLYRDIQGGDSGEDVKALQRTLQSMGIYRGRINGSYDGRTSQAVQALYKRAGAAPPSPDSQAAGDAADAKNAQKAEEGSTKDPNAASGAGAAGQAAEQSKNAQANTKAALTPLRRAEIVSLPSGQATVVSIAAVNTRIGDQTPFAQLRSGESSVTVRIGVGDKDSFPVGSSAEVQSLGDAGAKAAGNIAGVSEFRQADPEKNAVPGYDVTVKVPDPGSMVEGQEVTVSVSSNAGAVTGLAVPVTALRKEGATTYVTLAATKKQVPVTVRITSDGYAVLAESSLKAGDEVVVSEQS